MKAIHSIENGRKWRTQWPWAGNAAVRTCRLFPRIFPRLFYSTYSLPSSLSHLIYSSHSIQDFFVASFLSASFVALRFLWPLAPPPARPAPGTSTFWRAYFCGPMAPEVESGARGGGGGIPSGKRGRGPLPGPFPPVRFSAISRRLDASRRGHDINDQARRWIHGGERAYANE